MYRDLVDLITENYFLVPESDMLKSMTGDYLIMVVEADAEAQDSEVINEKFKEMRG